VLDVDAEHVLEVAAVEDEEPLEAFSPDGADEPFGGRVRLRRTDRSLTMSMPSLAKTASKLRVNLASRSPITKRKLKGRRWSIQVNCRACCVTHSPVGLAVQPAR
jgi:hypothetical protein